MRMFPVYAPKLIVKHARIFLCGVVWVKDLGRLEFDRGRFLLPKKSLPKVTTSSSSLAWVMQIRFRYSINQQGR